MTFIPKPEPVKAVLPTSPDTPGSDPGITGYRDVVRTLIRDGQPSYATSAYGIVRQEQLSQQVPTSGSQSTYMVQFSQIPLGKNITVFAVPSSIAAYVDGSTSPQTITNGGVTSDIDQNGNFTLKVAPTSGLLVTYGWQIFQDGDIDQLLDQARSWLGNWATVDVVPDGMQPALTLRSAGLACESISRQLALPDVTAGDAKENLSGVAKMYAQAAKDFLARADTARSDYWTSADQPKQPAAATMTVKYPVYQPFR